MGKNRRKKGGIAVAISVFLAVLIILSMCLLMQETRARLIKNADIRTAVAIEEVYEEEKELIEKDVAHPNGRLQVDGYDFLTGSEKKAYNAVLQMLNDFETDVSVDQVNTKGIQLVFDAINYDHPEIFWKGEFSYYFDEGDQSVSRVKVKYPYDLVEKNRRQAEIDVAFTEYLRGMEAGISDYEKVKYTYEFVIKNTTYVEGSADNQNIYSVLGRKESVCAGYAKTIQYFLKSLGMECYFVIGDVIGRGAHAWNIVCIEGEYYYLDATWGEINVPGQVEMSENISYDYFCVTSDVLLKTHVINSSLIEYPVLTATASNYFVKENRLYQLDVESEQDRFVDDLTATVQSDARYFHYAITSPEIFEIAEMLMGDVLGTYYWYTGADEVSHTIDLKR